jgi:hypothetical protein
MRLSPDSGVLVAEIEEQALQVLAAVDQVG